jgi:hypothetical protein
MACGTPLSRHRRGAQRWSGCRTGSYQHRPPPAPSSVAKRKTPRSRPKRQTSAIRPQHTTIGVSPKLVVAVVTAVLTYLMAQQVMAFPPGIVVTGQALLVALAVFRAPPGVTVAHARDATDNR